MSRAKICITGMNLKSNSRILKHKKRTDRLKLILCLRLCGSTLTPHVGQQVSWVLLECLDRSILMKWQMPGLVFVDAEPLEIPMIRIVTREDPHLVPVHLLPPVCAPEPWELMLEVCSPTNFPDLSSLRSSTVLVSILATRGLVGLYLRIFVYS